MGPNGSQAQKGQRAQWVPGPTGPNSFTEHLLLVGGQAAKSEVRQIRLDIIYGHGTTSALARALAGRCKSLGCRHSLSP